MREFMGSGGGSAHDLTPLAWRRGAWGVGRETIVQVDVGGQPGFLAAKRWVGRSALSADLLVGWGKTPRNGHGSKTPAIRVTVLALSTGVGSCSGFCLPWSGGISLPGGASPRVTHRAASGSALTARELLVGGIWFPRRFVFLLSSTVPRVSGRFSSGASCP